MQRKMDERTYCTNLDPPPRPQMHEASKARKVYDYDYDYKRRKKEDKNANFRRSS